MIHKNREDGLTLSISELEAREAELKKATTEFQQHLAELQEYRDFLNPEVKQQLCPSQKMQSIIRMRMAFFLALPELSHHLLGR